MRKILIGGAGLAIIAAIIAALPLITQAQPYYGDLWRLRDNGYRPGA